MVPLTVMLLTAADDMGLLGSYGRAFRKLGCDVRFWEFEAVRIAHARLGRVGAILQNLVVVEPWLNRANRDFVVAVREQRPDIVCIANATRITAGALAQVRASLPTTKLVLFWPDPLQNMLAITVQALPLYDLVATYSRSSVAPLQRMGASRVEWVPFAMDPELFGGAPGGGHRSFECEVGFIGNFRREREDAVLALGRSGVDVKVWGSDDWARRAANKRAVRDYWQGRVLSGKEFAVATRSFKIALNVIDPTNFPSANMRFFETLGCAGALLTSPCPELEPDFPDGIAAFYYLTPDDLVTRVRDLLRHEGGTRAVVLEGLRRVLASHTYAHRSQQVLEALGLGTGALSR